MEELTPMLRQYRNMKQDMDPDTILMFRLGDFYELFMEDAREAAPLLGVALTHRAGHPMCGVPHHALDTYLAKLIRADRKVAICDQMEDPKTVKSGKMVRREVTRIVTPGTITEETILSDEVSNYLVAVVPEGSARSSKGSDGYALAVLELSTGEFFCEFPETRPALVAAIQRLAPGEALVPDLPDESPLEQDVEAALREGGVRCLTPVDSFYFDAISGHDTLLRHFGVSSLDGFGCEGRPALDAAAGALLRRVRDDLHRDLSHVRRLRPRASAGHMMLDETTCSHLNLFPEPDGRNKGVSLYDVLNSTCTPMGARLLRAWIARPLCDKARIDARLDAIGGLIAGRGSLTPLRDALSDVRDLARAIARVSLGRGSARDLVSISTSLKAVPALRERLDRIAADSGAPLLAEVRDGLRALPETTGEIDATLVDDPPATLADGGVIRKGFSPELDELRDAQTNGRTWVAAYQASEAARTGIKTLKVRYNKVFGYFIEVSASQLSLVPENYTRKQTIANGERFTTPELKEREELIAGAEAKSLALEARLFDELRAHVTARTGDIQDVASALARLDVLCSLADRALALGYVRPEIAEDDALDIRGGRHAIVEQLPDAERFVPNDTSLNGSTRQIMVITGPNMAGKSTYIRQVALLVVMAQIGSYLPADSARIGLVDRVFTRVGASDDLARGRSTFLVEMQETANILNNATPRSLIVLDEIGRGTSTFDGISIAWAVAEYLHNTASVKAKTLFATHYHELTDLSATLPGIVNCSVLVRERGDGIVFLRRIVEGPADKSYGIAVAKLAGMPEGVLSRAREILSGLEAREQAEIGAATASPANPPSAQQPVLPFVRKKKVVDERQMTFF